MEQCSICLDSLDGGVVALAACGHRFHAACLAQMAGAVGTATTRRGSLTACPNCRTVSRVDDDYDASVLARATATATPRHERALAARRVASPAPVPQKRSATSTAPKPVEMRRVGDAAWRWFGSQRDAAKAFGVSGQDVSHLIKDPSKTPSREAFEARPARKRERPTEAKAPLKKQKWVEGAHQKKNGKWRSEMFPGREFDDLDAYRAAKKQRAARRAAWSAQCTHKGL